MLIEHIEKLLNGEITAYKIAKDLEINPNIIQRYITGDRKIENMTLKTAEKLYKYYIDTQKES
ncbi:MULTISPECIES: hypothetical protein [unclassified Gemella]|uniref:hypothetical protein n=1 Tax=unclassified Gemella TaxID=2624949 RepID=UPI001C042257|nr:MULTISPECIES: hypothetical protein [unclassified Gemella]MBU0278139.1 hypothetical protein [Gemella sp. zg-1178]QWQ38336.1 hypothetical protein KMP11_05075 [Gemella sp. zg-570]